MIDVRSQHIKVSHERRQYPRLEFHCTAIFGDLNQVCKVTDLSLNGVFVEVEDKTGLEPGSQVNLTIKFPMQDRAIRFKAKIVNINRRGVGCQLVKLAPNAHEAIKNCFNTFSDTLPLS